MNESRTLTVAGRRFGRSDLERIGRLFLDQHTQSAADGRHSQFRATVKAEDQTVYQSDSLDLLGETSDAMLKRPVFIELSYTDYTRSRSLRFNATQGGSRSDRISADGDPGWVRDVFVQLQERISAATPTSHWVTRHPYIVRTIAKLGLGSLVWLPYNWVVSSVVSHLPPPSPDVIAALRGSSLAILFWRPAFAVVDFILTWIMRWMFGNAIWIFAAGWFYQAFPDVELDFGPEHFKREKMQRRRLEFLIITVLIPLFVAVLYDIVKSVWNSA